MRPLYESNQEFDTIVSIVVALVAVTVVCLLVTLAVVLIIPLLVALAVLKGLAWALNRVAPY